MKRKAIYWEAMDTEALQWTDIDDAVEAALDRSGRTTGRLKVYGFARSEVVMPSVLDNLIETLDEEYQEHYTEPTDKMREAEKAFLAIVKEEYKPWTCDVVDTREIDIAEWHRDNPGRVAT